MGKKLNNSIKEKNLKIPQKIKNLKTKHSIKNNNIQKNISCKRNNNNFRKIQRREKNLLKKTKDKKEKQSKKEITEDEISKISNNPEDIINKDKLDNKNQKYFLRNNKKFNNNIKELLKDLSDNNSDNESSMLEEESDFSISSYKSNNDYQSDKLLETFISNSGNSRYLDPFYSFLCETDTRNYLSKRNNNIIITENYDSFCTRVLEESKYSWNVKELLPKIFELLYEDLKIYWKNQLYILSYFTNYIEKWQIFFQDELSRNGDNYYHSKYLRIKRYKREHLYGIKDYHNYNYIMKRLISYFPADKKWLDYWYYLQLIPKNILLSYYIVLKERNRYFLQVLSDLKNFIETVIRFGGMKGFCRKMKLIFIDKKKDYWISEYRSKKQFDKHFIS